MRWFGLLPTLGPATRWRLEAVMEEREILGIILRKRRSTLRTNTRERASSLPRVRPLIHIGLARDEAEGTGWQRRHRNGRHFALQHGNRPMLRGGTGRQRLPLRSLDRWFLVFSRLRAAQAHAAWKQASAFASTPSLAKESPSASNSSAFSKPLATLRPSTAKR